MKEKKPLYGETKKIRRDGVNYIVGRYGCYVEWKKVLFTLDDLKFFFNKLEDISEEFVDDFEKEGLGYEKNKVLERLKGLLELAIKPSKPDLMLILQFEGILKEIKNLKKEVKEK